MAHKSMAIQRRFNDSGNPKKVAGFNRNRWPLSTGISGRIEPESVATLGRNMHFSMEPPKIASLRGSGESCQAGNLG